MNLLLGLFFGSPWNDFKAEFAKKHPIETI